MHDLELIVMQKDEQNKIFSRYLGVSPGVPKSTAAAAISDELD